ncbi:MAG: MBL fold metallo-hydrolase, partial [Candidatus Zixiibacteriota bacterium]
MPLEIVTLTVGPFVVNCYLVRDNVTADTVVIDPGAEPDLLISRLNRQEVRVRGILLTHGHGDHIAAVQPLKEHFDVPLYVGAGEEKLLANPSANVSALFDMPITAPPPDVTLSDEEVIQ